MEYWKQELYHHGILGMKWGKRNGPPYPLSPGQHSESEKKAGWRKSLSKTQRRNAKDTGRSELTERQKKYYFNEGETHVGMDLTRKGKEFNKKQREKFDSKKEILKYNMKVVDKRYDKLVNEYLDIKEKNNINYLKNKEEWYKNTDGPFKDVDYYQFKDITADMWINSDYGKRESELRKSIEKIVQHTFDESPYKDQSYLKLTSKYEYDKDRGFYQDMFLENVDYGKEMVSQIMRDIDNDAISRQYHDYAEVPLDKR